MNVAFRDLVRDDLRPDLLDGFNRFQKVERYWEMRDERWVLIESAFVMDWSLDYKRRVATQEFPELINSGGTLIGAFHGKTLVGFAGLDATLIGSRNQYLWLDKLHVANEYRGSGIGREMFTRIAAAASALGGAKLYICSNPSEDSQSFYRALGCEHAIEVIDRFGQPLTEATPVHPFRNAGRDLPRIRFILRATGFEAQRTR